MKAQFTLIQNADIYAPEPIGKNDILFCTGKLITIAPKITVPFGTAEVIDAVGKKAIPGLIDQHVHVTGGGGEGSFKSRVPELRLSDCIESGVTTLVGLLGTDSITRSVENLVAKTKALNEEGLTAYCLTGAYEYPSPTITGSVKKDIAFINEVIGVKIAISDHRSSAITTQELARLAADVRQAALISGKPGVVHMHAGRGKEGLSQIIEIVENTNIPISHFRPTHMQCREDVFRFAQLGGYVDFTAREDPKESAALLKEASERIPWDQVTFSSDSNGSMPRWNEEHEMIGMGIGRMTNLFNGIRELVLSGGMSLSDALKPVTETVAKALEIYPQKGSLCVGGDADLVLLSDELEIDSVFAKGKTMMLNKKVLAKGYFGE